jgi:hypothetical protein
MITHISERERRIDEALEETFPASDPPFFVGAGAPKPAWSVTKDSRASEAFRTVSSSTRKAEALLGFSSF